MGKGWRTVQCGASLPSWCHLELGGLGLGPGSAIFPAGGLTPPSIHSFCMNGVQILPCRIQPGCYAPNRIPSFLSAQGTRSTGGFPNLSSWEGDFFLHIKVTSAHQEGLSLDRVRFATSSKDALLLAAALTVSLFLLCKMRKRVVHKAMCGTRGMGRGQGGPQPRVRRAALPTRSVSRRP